MIYIAFELYYLTYTILKFEQHGVCGQNKRPFPSVISNGIESLHILLKLLLQLHFNRLPGGNAGLCVAFHWNFTSSGSVGYFLARDCCQFLRGKERAELVWAPRQGWRLVNRGHGWSIGDDGLVMLGAVGICS